MLENVEVKVQWPVATMQSATVGNVPQSSPADTRAARDNALQRRDRMPEGFAQMCAVMRRCSMLAVLARNNFRWCCALCILSVPLAGCARSCARVMLLPTTHVHIMPCALVSLCCWQTFVTSAFVQAELTGSQQRPVALQHHSGGVCTLSLCACRLTKKYS